MRCLHLTLTTARGGRRDAILTLIEHLRLLGVTCGLVGLRDTPAEVAPLQGGLDFHDGVAVEARPTPRALLHLWRLCRDQRIEVLHAHDAGSQVVASALRCVLPKLRVVMTFHRTLGLDTEGWRNRLRNGVTLPLVSRVITNSEERRHYFRQTVPIPPERVVVIPHGTTLTTFHPDTSRRASIREELGLPPESRLILAVGHFGPEKGIDLAVQAVAAARRHDPAAPMQLVVLGTGTPERQATLEALAASLGGGVTFLGFRQDVARWLQGADVLLHAPRLEAFGLVLIQAMACGLPVVATRVGGVPELVTDGRTGVLVEQGDTEALGRALADLLGDPARRAALREAALADARARFDARECARRHLALYEAVLG